MIVGSKRAHLNGGLSCFTRSGGLAEGRTKAQKWSLQHSPGSCLSVAGLATSGGRSIIEGAEEADRQARAITRDLTEVGRKKGFRVEYQKREARFALRAGYSTSYFSANDYQGPKGMDWLRLRIDILIRVRDGASQTDVNED